MFGPDTEINANNRAQPIDTLTESPDIYRVESPDTYRVRAKDAGYNYISYRFTGIGQFPIHGLQIRDVTKCVNTILFQVTFFCNIIFNY